MPRDTRCKQCGAILQHIATEPGEHDDMLQHHYRCQNPACAADGGTIITLDGATTRRVGPSCDSSHDLPRPVADGGIKAICPNCGAEAIPEDDGVLGCQTPDCYIDTFVRQEGSP